MSLRVALIGAGRMGTNHARVIGQLDGLELVAIAETERDVGERLARRTRARLYNDHRELLRVETPDCVVIAAPSAQHMPVAIDCLRAGTDVLLEKPIALCSADAIAIIEAAREHGRHLRVGHTERFNPAVQELRSRLGSGQAGRVIQIVARRMSPFQPHVKDQGVVLDLGTHDLDVMRYLLGEEPIRAFAMARRHIHTAHEDLLAGLVEFEGGAVCVIETNWLTPTKVRDLVVLGTRGMFVVNYLPQELLFYENALVPSQWESPGDILLGVGEGLVVRYPLQHVEPLRAEWEAFMAAIQEADAPGATGEDALRTLLLAEALSESARTGQTTVIAPARVA